MMTTTVLEVRGMTCGHCQESVERALTGAPGVRSARVDLEAGKAQVLHDRTADPHALVAAVKDAGFDARIASV